MSNEIVQEMDLLSTLAQFVGGKLPDDRVIDGVDQSAFLSGKTEKSNREALVVYVGKEIYGVKWRDWKMMVKEVDMIAGEPVRSYSVLLFYNRLLDPKEVQPILNAPESLWVRYPAGQVLLEHMMSLKSEQPIPPGAPSTYSPVAR